MEGLQSSPIDVTCLLDGVENRRISLRSNGSVLKLRALQSVLPLTMLLLLSRSTAVNERALDFQDTVPGIKSSTTRASIADPHTASIGVAGSVKPRHSLEAPAIALAIMKHLILRVTQPSQGARDRATIAVDRSMQVGPAAVATPGTATAKAFLMALTVSRAFVTTAALPAT